jgi:hypothetical protein
MGTICLFVRSLAVMRHVKIIERPNETYPFAAIDQQTGEIPLRLTERGDLVALCDRLGWVVQEDSQPAGALRSADLSQRIGERHRALITGHRHRPPSSRVATAGVNPADGGQLWTGFTCCRMLERGLHQI